MWSLKFQNVSINETVNLKANFCSHTLLPVARGDILTIINESLTCNQRTMSILKSEELKIKTLVSFSQHLK